MNTETEQIFLLAASTSHSSTSSQKIIIESPETTQVNLENVEDFSNVCRICATITEFVIPIFDGEGLQNNLAEKIHKHLPIEVTVSDVLPRVVCYQCASTLLAWHELVQCSLQAERALRARLARAGAGSQSDQSTQDPKPTDRNSISEDATDSKADASAGNDRASRSPEASDRGPCPAAAGSGAPKSIKAGPGHAPETRRCMFCGEEHPRSEHRKQPAIDHADAPFHCGDCGEYVSRKDFILHTSLHAVQGSRRWRVEKREASEPQPGGKTRTCPECGKAYRASSSYFYHMRQAHGARRELECAACGRRCGSRAALARHAALHSPDARPKGKRFRSRAHEATHAEPRSRWPCAACPRAFASRAGLSRHALRHAAARWACSRCPRRFHVRADLTRHARTHAPARLPCRVCGKLFAQPRYLLAHARNVHAREPPVAPIG